MIMFVRYYERVATTVIKINGHTKAKTQDKMSLLTSNHLSASILLYSSIIVLLQISLIGCVHYQQHNGFPVGPPQSLAGTGQQQAANQESLSQNVQQQQASVAGQPSDRSSPLQVDGQSLALDQRPVTNGGGGGGGNGHTSRSSEREGPIFRYHGIALNSTSVKLVWNLLNGYHADFFDIEWGPIPDGTHQFSLNKLNGTARDHTFHQLQPDTQYQFELRLNGYHGNHGYRPQLVAVRTPPANYAAKAALDNSIMPLGVKAEPKTTSSIQVSWSELDKPTSARNSVRVNIIRFHIINPAAAAAGGQVAATNETPATTSSSQAVSPQYHYLNLTNSRDSRVLISKLQPATEYAFAVKTTYYTPDMKRKLMESGYSMDTVSKTLDLEPSAPRNFTIAPLVVDGNFRLELSWLPPESPNGQIKNYTVLWMFEQPLNQQQQALQNADSAQQQWIKFNVDPLRSSHQVGSLRPGGTYYFKMKALNQRGYSPETETRSYTMPALAPLDMPVPQSNIFLVIVIGLVAVVFCMFLLVSRLACKPRKKSRKGSLKTGSTSDHQKNGADQNTAKLNGFVSTNSGVSSTVAARVGTLARRRDNAANGKPDFWISAMDSGHQMVSSDVKSNISEKSNSDLNMAMVSLQRESPQFATTQLAPNLPDYRFASMGGQHHSQLEQQQHLLQQIQQQQQQAGHYHPGHFTGNALGYDQMDSATASALMTLSKRQQQQMQKYQIQFASTGGTGSPAVSSAQTTNQVGGAQAPSPHQQPPPPPPLNIEQQQQQQQQHHHQHHQPLYGTHQTMANTRSLRLHRPTLYDPVSGSFLQSAEAGPPNYNSHHQHMFLNNNNNLNGAPQYNPLSGLGANSATASNTLQFHHPHQSSTLLSRRSTNTLRSFQTANHTSQPTGTSLYGQLAAGNTNGNPFGTNFAVPAVPPNSVSSVTQPQQLLQSHQAVINQLNNSTYPSLPLKHVSAVRPQIMSNLDDQIEMELAEKEHQEQQNNTNNQHQPQQQDQQQTIKQ